VVAQGNSSAANNKLNYFSNISAPQGNTSVAHDRKIQRRQGNTSASYDHVSRYDSIII